MLLWTGRAQSLNVYQKFSQILFCCRYAKAKHFCIFMFFYKKNYPLDRLNEVLTSWLSFLCQNSQIFIQFPRNEKKTNLQRTSFPHNVTVDNTSTLLTSLPKSFRELFFAVSTRKLNVCTFLSFSNEKKDLLDT